MVDINGWGKRLLSVRSRLAGNEFNCVVSEEAAQQIQTRRIGDVWRNLRAELTGKIHYESLGRIRKVEAQEIRFFPPSANLPDIGDIQDESFTGGRRSEDFPERVRRGELSKDPTSASEAASRFHEFLKLEYVLLVTLDSAVGEKARERMQGGCSGLKPPDAIHIATAIVANAHAMHTFDRKLLDLDGLLVMAHGSKLKICKPDPGGSLPLFEH